MRSIVHHCGVQIESHNYFRRKQLQGRFYLQTAESHRTRDQFTPAERFFEVI